LCHSARRPGGYRGARAGAASERSAQTVLCCRKPSGSGSIIGTSEAAKAAPDGYTLLVMSDTHTTNESLQPNKPYQLMRDFVAVAPINYTT
jgi:tripartite-type tricarboxylate transporter receptor subunit TctC